ncbi:MAG: CRISPR-associated endonuclease Cas1 [Candidatus Accumulibacter sp.]|uniref:CRISPR-associated endonuclease Cas1 n=1 Tax=Accumulibacter sp. TaxID=2053492 RepID=UPI00258682E6|nr:CRISPR-associated endonuclease Cas1 [Accumulibacter sp.]MCM8624108.1 CRISPR-associated endonuclease Cas1 [Accumulibacter sp.]
MQREGLDLQRQGGEEKGEGGQQLCSQTLRFGQALTSARRQLCGLGDTPEPRPDAVEALRGLEGAGAAAYFEGFAELLPARLHFNGRNRRPPRDPANALLSLGYTLLHAEAVLALYGAGLDPFIGFYHALDFGRESLACDLVEPLRVEVDQHALMLFRSEKLRPEDFSSTQSGCLLGKAGRARFYAEWEALAARLRKLLAESICDVANAISAAGAAGAPCPAGSTAPATDTEVDDDDF